MRQRRAVRRDLEAEVGAAAPRPRHPRRPRGGRGCRPAAGGASRMSEFEGVADLKAGAPEWLFVTRSSPSKHLTVTYKNGRVVLLQELTLQGEDMRRRDLIRLVGLSPALPLVARAQQGAPSGRVAKVGVLWHAGSAEEEKVYLDMLTKAFDDLGYVEGKNIVFLHRFPAEQLERFRGFARELVESKPDVIVATNPSGAAVLKQTTNA